jgi:hypothetical protein
MNHIKLLRVLAGLLLAGLLVAACAEPDPEDGGAGQGQGGATTVPTTQPANPPTTRALRPAGEITVIGTVSEGVEAGCLVLDAEGGTRYLLVGGERNELRSGARVAVTGRIARELLSICQQGEPLVVTSIKPAP